MSHWWYRTNDQMLTFCLSGLVSPFQMSRYKSLSNTHTDRQIGSGPNATEARAGGSTSTSARSDRGTARPVSASAVAPGAGGNGRGIVVDRTDDVGGVEVGCVYQVRGAPVVVVIVVSGRQVAAFPLGAPPGLLVIVLQPLLAEQPDLLLDPGARRVDLGHAHCVVRRDVRAVVRWAERGAAGFVEFVLGCMHAQRRGTVSDNDVGDGMGQKGERERNR